MGLHTSAMRYHVPLSQPPLIGRLSRVTRSGERLGVAPAAMDKGVPRRHPPEGGPVNEIQVTISGNLTAEPELRYTTAHRRPVLNLRVASTPQRRDESGDWVDEPTTFLNTEVWGRLAEVAAGELHRGSGVLIRGRLRTEVWTPAEGEHAGQEQRRLKVIADDIAPTYRFVKSASSAAAGT